MGNHIPEAIIVFGANGFVGRHLVHALAQCGVSVIALTSKPFDNPPLGVEVRTGTFNTPEAFTPWLKEARVIIHAASRSTPGRTAGKPMAELNDNLLPTLSMLEALQSAPHCELLYLSSGGTLYGDTESHPANENDLIRPKSYYGAGKAAAEHFIHAYVMQFNRAATLLRPSNLYGPGQTLRGGFGVIPTAFDRIQTQKPFTLWGDGLAVRDYLYIDDFTELCLAIVAQPMPKGSRLFNAASGQGISLNQLLQTIINVTGETLRIEREPQRSVDVARVVLNPHTVEQVIGWHAQTTIEEGISRTWDWWRLE
jgi:UDP-glucose 4-epimerase